MAYPFPAIGHCQRSTTELPEAPLWTTLPPSFDRVIPPTSVRRIVMSYCNCSVGCSECCNRPLKGAKKTAIATGDHAKLRTRKLGATRKNQKNGSNCTEANISYLCYVQIKLNKMFHGPTKYIQESKHPQSINPPWEAPFPRSFYERALTMAPYAAFSLKLPSNKVGFSPLRHDC